MIGNRYGLLWQAQPKNKKTGPIPTAYVGHSYDEAYASCDGCPLRETICYAHARTPRMGMMSMTKAASGHPHRSATATDAVAPGGRYSLEYSIESAEQRRVSVARIGALGEPSRVDRDVLLDAYRRLRARNFSLITYTHFWNRRDGRWLKKHAMASCDNLELADRALERGWRPAAIVDPGTPGKTVQTPKGASLFVCPAQRARNIQCKDCGLCDPQHPTWERLTAAGIVGIAFLEH